MQKFRIKIVQDLKKTTLVYARAGVNPGMLIQFEYAWALAIWHTRAIGFVLTRATILGTLCMFDKYKIHFYQ